MIYLLATCVSGMFSSHRCINVFGVMALTLAIAAAFVSIMTFVSVWCFFAAVLSLLIYIHFSGPMQACRLDERDTHGSNSHVLGAEVRKAKPS